MESLDCPDASILTPKRNVTVTALHIDTGSTFVGVTDASGKYQINALRTGAYTVKVELPGFR